MAKKKTYQINIRNTSCNHCSRHHVVDQDLNDGFLEAVVGVVRHQLLWFQAEEILNRIGYGWGCGWRERDLALGWHVVTTGSCTTNAWEIRNMTGLSFERLQD